MMVNRQSRVPLYYQLYELLRAQIVRKELEAGEMLPTENDLIARYEVSRNTVRQALDSLVDDGLITRHRGRGSFVTHPTIAQGANRIVSFTDDMRHRGLTPHTEVLRRELVAAPESIAHALGIEPGEELAHLDRLRLADREPMSVEHSYLISRLCPGVLDLDYATVPLREALERRYGIVLSRATQTIRAVAATKQQAARLAIDPGAALLTIERVSYADNEQPVEYLRLYHRGDRYAFYSELRG